MMQDKKFLVDIGNDFIQKSIGKTLMIKSSLKKGTAVEDQELAKFAMSKIISLLVWDQYFQKEHRGDKEAKKEQKLI